jgi:hypothetical protein
MNDELNEMNMDGAPEEHENPLDFMHMDATEADFILTSDGPHAGHPIITVLMDTATGTVIGMHVHVEGPRCGTGAE